MSFPSDETLSEQARDLPEAARGPFLDARVPATPTGSGASRRCSPNTTRP